MEKATITAAEVLGESEILDPRHEDWSENSENMRLLGKYASRETISRARRLLGTRDFLPAISRKINGPLLLRKQVDEWRGNKALTAYSGARMAIRCADDNPRHMIRIFNSLLMLRSAKHKWRMHRGLPIWRISREDQTRAMRSLSTSTLNQYRSFPEVGAELHELLWMIGEFMRIELHEKPLTTDQITSIMIDNTISLRDWKLVRIAVGHGLLHPNVGSANPDEMPWREGTFHLAYALAPHFLLLPRRGKAVKLSAIQEFHIMSPKEKEAYLGRDPDQLHLFDEGTSK
jgi:hypothetical protein